MSGDQGVYYKQVILCTEILLFTKFGTVFFVPNTTGGRMRHPVLEQVADARKSRSACLTQVWLDSSMQAAVCYQALSVCERFRAIETVEWLLTSVAPLVDLQLAFPPKSLAAESVAM